MVRTVNRSYLTDLVNRCYKKQDENCYFCFKVDCVFCNTSSNIEEELRKNKCNTQNASVLFWRILYSKTSELTIFATTKWQLK